MITLAMAAASTSLRPSQPGVRALPRLPPPVLQGLSTQRIASRLGKGQTHLRLLNASSLHTARELRVTDDHNRCPGTLEHQGRDFAGERAGKNVGDILCATSILVPFRTAATGAMVTIGGATDDSDIASVDCVRMRAGECIHSGESCSLLFHSDSHVFILLLPCLIPGNSRPSRNSGKPRHRGHMVYRSEKPNCSCSDGTPPPTTVVPRYRPPWRDLLRSVGETSRTRTPQGPFQTTISRLELTAMTARVLDPHHANQSSGDCRPIDGHRHACSLNASATHDPSGRMTRTRASRFPGMLSATSR